MQICANGIRILQHAVNLRRILRCSLFCQLLKFSFRQRGICFFGNELCRTQGTDLTRVECGAARPRHTMRSGALTSGKQSAHRRLPPEIDRDSTVAMLCAKRDLQILPRQIHILIQIQFHCGFVHLHESIDRRSEGRAGLAQIGIRLIREPVKFDFLHAERIFRKIQIDAAAPQHAFTINQQIHDGRAVQHLL